MFCPNNFSFIQSNIGIFKRKPSFDGDGENNIYLYKSKLKQIFAKVQVFEWAKLITRGCYRNDRNID